MTDRTKIYFLGSGAIAVPVLRAVAAARELELCGVGTQLDRPAGRNRKPTPTPVGAAALELGIEPDRLASVNTAEFQERLRMKAPDLILVVSFGQILRAGLLELPPGGCVNIHASLLPRWRGAAPIARAIMAGDGESGITIMRMDAGLDTGPMLLRESLPIAAADTAGSLHDALAALGAKLALQALDRLAGGESLPETPQPAEGATYAKKIDKAEARIDWTRGADEVWRQVRGLSPFPGAWCKYRGERLKVLAAEPADGAGEPGTAIDANLAIACGRGAIRLIRLQRAGGGITGAAEFLRGHPLPPGTRLT